ncbi:hypothetical protein ACFPYI_07910 [Halomarina salina]|uniref:Uncharacterized protein n=1 Tax=Halomarina salina TaxID=1872699 RepID=A0ABD5RL90_9EURY|nr:hypothetical protein [Halomarina salina]
MSEQRSDDRESSPRTGASDAERTDTEAEDEEVDTSHLDGLVDGCGCAEMMDHLSEEREKQADS